MHYVLMWEGLMEVSIGWPLTPIFTVCAQLLEDSQEEWAGKSCVCDENNERAVDALRNALGILQLMHYNVQWAKLSLIQLTMTCVKTAKSSSVSIWLCVCFPWALGHSLLLSDLMTLGSDENWIRCYCYANGSLVKTDSIDPVPPNLDTALFIIVFQRFFFLFQDCKMNTMEELKKKINGGKQIVSVKTSEIAMHRQNPHLTKLHLSLNSSRNFRGFDFSAWFILLVLCLLTKEWIWRLVPTALCLCCTSLGWSPAVS